MGSDLDQLLGNIQSSIASGGQQTTLQKAYPYLVSALIIATALAILLAVIMVRS
jgi:hypothetical protein